MMRRPFASLFVSRLPFFLALISLLVTGAWVRPGIAQQPQSDEVIRVNSDLVLVNVTVTDESGLPVGNLQQSDFAVAEDSKPQSISFFGSQSTPFAAIILLDASGSMEQRMSLARSAAIRFVEGLRPEDAVAVYQFDSKIKKVQDFSASSDLSSRVFDAQAQGLTVLYDAIVQAARDLAARPERRKAIIVLSDGEDTKSEATQSKALNAAMAVDAAIYSIDMTQDGTGTSRNQRLGMILRELSEKTGGIYVGTGGGPALRDACKKIVQELSEQYTIGYQPTNQALDGRWRSINVQSKKGGLKIRARKGYRAAKAS